MLENGKELRNAAESSKNVYGIFDSVQRSAPPPPVRRGGFPFDASVRRRPRITAIAVIEIDENNRLACSDWKPRRFLATFYHRRNRATNSCFRLRVEKLTHSRLTAAKRYCRRRQ